MAKLTKTEGGCLITEKYAQEICEHMDNAAIHAPIPAIPVAATTAPVPDNEIDTAIRTAQVGTSDLYARADHNHAIVRQTAPASPVLTFSGSNGSAMSSQLVLGIPRTTEEWVAYHFRAIVRIEAGSGWNIIRVPSLAGFQLPIIIPINSYMPNSTQVQNDDTGNGNGFGASPRGPHMDLAFHEWSKSRSMYYEYFRVDNAHTRYPEFVALYVRA